MSTQQTSKVASQSEEAKSHNDYLFLTHALMGGTTAMRKAGQKLLPAFPNEEPEAYQRRLGSATLYPAYSHTVTTLAGKPLTHPIDLGEDIDKELAGHLKNIDRQGNNLDSFATRILESVLGHGFAGVLVDYPVTKSENDTKPMSREEEKKLGARPYCVLIDYSQILGWKVSRASGVEELSQLRLMESVEEDDGPWHVKTVEQVRVIEPSRWTVYRKNDKDEWIEHSSGINTLGRVPFVPFYGIRTGFMKFKPPMLELAHLNVKHWQSQSDQDTILHVARVPILTFTGIDDASNFSVTVGASAICKLPLGADGKYIEHSGAAIGAGAASLEALKDEMRQSGAQLLVSRGKAATATEIATDNVTAMSDLQRIVVNVEDALDNVLAMMAQWMGLQDGGTVTLFKDFSSLMLDTASADYVLQLKDRGIISKKRTLTEFRRRNIVSEDLDVEDELEEAGAEGPEVGDTGGSGE